jgi:hypothetical protein
MNVVPVKDGWEVRYEKSNRKVAFFKTLKEAIEFAFEMEKQKWLKYNKGATNDK